MNKPLRLFLLLPALALAYSCAADPEHNVDTVETGTAEQPVTYTLHNNHGYRSSTHDRCVHNPKNYSTSNFCVLPPRRNLGVNINSGSCPGYATQASQAVQFMALDTNPRGWSLAEVASGGSIFVRCVRGELIGELGSTQFVGSVFDQGSRRHYNTANVRIDLNQIESTASSPTQRQNLFRTAVKHEIGHALGLGHHNASSPCLQSLMRVGNVPGCSEVQGNVGLQPIEYDILSTFDVD